MPKHYPDAESMPMGVVVRRQPGVTRWARWSWRATDVLPGAAPADWKELRSDGDVTEFHAATRALWLYVSDTEAYVHELATRQPSLYIIMRHIDGRTDAPLELVMVTASPYEAQDYADSGEEIIEKVPMPPVVLAWISDFVNSHHVEEVFVKRRRDKAKTDGKQAGIGDSRISQVTDVYRAPTRREGTE